MMTFYDNPGKDTWRDILARPSKDAGELNGVVSAVMRDVRDNGDAALRKYEELFDKARLAELKVSDAEFDEAERAVPESLKEAISVAYSNIRRFHEAQRFSPVRVETADGVVCEQRAVPIERVGLYVPGGTAPLFSTVLMLAVPARIAGCREIVLCTPPGGDSKCNAAILYCARLCGVTAVFKVGGSQAIAAMALGTESIPKVSKIFGPGNQYVVAAKQLASLMDVAIDMPAGPSEVEVVADASSNPRFVAADLLSQAEHGADSQVLLVATDRGMIEKVGNEVEAQLRRLPRRETASRALANSKAIYVPTKRDVIEISNAYAPEHLVIATDDYREIADGIVNAGSVFLGPYSCESAGDYASGTNHTLPTKGYAKAYSGLSLDSFMRKMTLQHLSPRGVRAIGRAVETMAAAEGLDAHRRAMAVRLDYVNNPNPDAK